LFELGTFRVFTTVYCVVHLFLSIYFEQVRKLFKLLFASVMC